MTKCPEGCPCRDWERDIPKNHEEHLARMTARQTPEGRAARTAHSYRVVLAHVGKKCRPERAAFMREYIGLSESGDWQTAETMREAADKAADELAAKRKAALEAAGIPEMKRAVLEAAGLA